MVVGLRWQQQCSCCLSRALQAVVVWRQGPALQRFADHNLPHGYHEEMVHRRRPLPQAGAMNLTAGNMYGFRQLSGVGVCQLVVATCSAGMLQR
jgi:hypothetical protein